MSTLFTHRMPADLIRTCFDKEQSTGQLPTLAEPQRSNLLGWLRRILLDFEALDQHLIFLQQLYKATFHYPSPRREGRNLDENNDTGISPGFAHCERLTDQQLTAVMDRGADIFSNEELIKLLLNPVALFDLHDTIDDVQPDLWLDNLHELANEVLPTESGVGKGSDMPSPAETKKPHSVAQDSDEFWRRFEQRFASAMSQSSRHQGAGLAPASITRWPTSLTVAVTAACAASVFAMILSFRALSRDDIGAPGLHAAANSAVKQPGQNTGLVLTSADGRLSTLEEIYRDGGLEPMAYELLPKDYLENISKHAEPALKALIQNLKAAGQTDLDILKKLHEIASSHTHREKQ